MGFSCEIYQGKKSLTKDDFISYKLFGLAPSGHEEDTDAPYSLSDMRAMVNCHPYGDKLKEAAQDCFLQLQAMARDNLDSLRERHCSSCECAPKKPKGWSVAAIERLLSIDAKTITKMSGGY